MGDSHKTYAIGQFTVTRVFKETSTIGTPQFLFPDWDPAVIEEHDHWLIPGCMDEAYDNLIRSIHSWVITTKRDTIIIDTGTGNDKDRPLIPSFHRLRLPYLRRLKAVGVEPEAVDYVILTHLHADHVGWNTRLVDDRWIPTFPKATYIRSKADQQFFASADSHTEHDKANLGVYEDSVLPVIEAGQAKLIEPDGNELLEGMAFHPAPGHCIGHMAVTLTSSGKHALFAGDVMHHPIQVYRPEWNSRFCTCAEQARFSRKWALDFAADLHALYFGGHFPDTSAGFVSRKGDSFQWRFATRPSA